MNFPDDSPSVRVLGVWANGGILFAKCLTDRSTLSECFSLEIDGLVGRSVNSFARQTTDQISKFRWIVLGVFHFPVESVSRCVVAQTSNPDLKIRDGRIARICCSEAVPFTDKRKSLRREVRSVSFVAACRNIPL